MTDYVTYHINFFEPVTSLADVHTMVNVVHDGNKYVQQLLSLITPMQVENPWISLQTLDHPKRLYTCGYRRNERGVWTAYSEEGSIPQVVWDFRLTVYLSDPDFLGADIFEAMFTGIDF